mmetsp:Transcript_14729/g.15230  ORF Transcript_14729/g.15230 Transcript_14729/m.15230 type:complete len:154 (+) Transcript_14729:26-487(+)
MSNSTNRRILNDLKHIKKEFEKGIFAEPLKDNLFLWHAIILGPPDSIWEGGCFKLTMEFPKDYPTKPPLVKFISSMFHPNIYTDGKICLDILDKSWVPMYDTSGVLQSIQLLLIDPNPNSPANTLAAKLYQDSHEEYKNHVYKCVEESWIHSS